MSDRIGIRREIELTENTPLTWFVRRYNEVFATITIVCARGHITTVGRNHTVAADGTVEPSYVCTAPGCAWHAWIQLLSYDLAAKPIGQTEVKVDSE